MPAKELNSVRKLGTPSVSQAAEAVLRSVWKPTHLPTTTADAKNVSAGTSTPRPPTPSVPLTKLLGRRGLTGARLLLALATTKASTLRGCTSTSTTAAATSTTAAAASTTAAATSTTSVAASTTSTAATKAPTPGTTPTSTATPSASSTASTTSPATLSTTLAPLSLAVAAPPTKGRRSSDLLSANEVDSSNRSNKGEKGGRGTPLKERGERTLNPLPLLQPRLGPLVVLQELPLTWRQVVLGVDAWVLDTGATQHMTACTTLLNNVTTVASVKRVMFDNRDTLDVMGQGDLRLMVDGGPLTIKNVLVVPRLGADLLSVSQFTRKGMRVNIEGTMMALSTVDGVHIGTARQAGGLFVLDALLSVASTQAATSTTSLSTWHNRLGHLHLAAIQAMATKGIVDGLEFVRSSGDDEKCVGCLEGKMARKPFSPSTKPNASEPFKLVHTDLCGPITPVSKVGGRYVLTLIDDATRICWIRLLKHKDATSTAIKQWVADVEKESGFKVKRFRSDGGGEYTARELGDC
ncbi:unnamed protein product [Closterium sp. NIES-54]